MDTSRVLNNFISYITVEKGLSKNTVLSYKADIVRFIDFLKQSNIELESAEHQDITNFLWSIKKEGLKPRSIYRAVESIRQLFKFLMSEEILKKNPTAYLSAPKLPENIPSMLDFEEVTLLLNSVGGNDIQSIRNKAMLELLYATGLRVSELINLKFSELNLNDNFVRIIGKGSKERIVPFGDKAKDFINIYLAKRKPKSDEEDFVFITRLGKKISRVEFWRQLKKIVADAGIKKNITPHSIRHSFASHLLSGGADIRFVQEMLGHSSIATTQIYTHIDEKRVKNQHKKYHPRG